MTPGQKTATLKERVAAELHESRRRSLALLDPLSEAEQITQHSPLMSPLVWDLAHVGNYEEFWLLREVASIPPTSPVYDDIYNAFDHPRATRTTLPLLGPAEARRYIADVRGVALDVLDGVDLEREGGNPLLNDGFVYGMVIQHEHQHDETILATLQLMNGDGYRPVAPAPPSGASAREKRGAAKRRSQRPPPLAAGAAAGTRLAGSLERPGALLAGVVDRTSAPGTAGPAGLGRRRPAARPLSPALTN